MSYPWLDSLLFSGTHLNPEDMLQLYQPQPFMTFPSTSEFLNLDGTLSPRSTEMGSPTPSTDPMIGQDGSIIPVPIENLLEEFFGSLHPTLDMPINHPATTAETAPISPIRVDLTDSPICLSPRLLIDESPTPRQENPIELGRPIMRTRVPSHYSVGLKHITLEHPLLVRTNLTTIQVLDPYHPQEFFHLYHVGQIASFVAADAEIRSGSYSGSAMPDGYHNFATLFNLFPNQRGIRFALFNFTTRVPVIAGAPPTLADFHINDSLIGHRKSSHYRRVVSYDPFAVVHRPTPTRRPDHHSKPYDAAFSKRRRFDNAHNVV